MFDFLVMTDENDQVWQDFVVDVRLAVNPFTLHYIPKFLLQHLWPSGEQEASWSSLYSASASYHLQRLLNCQTLTENIVDDNDSGGLEHPDI